MNSVPIKENYSLKHLTTFKIGGPARYFCEAHSVQDIRQAVCFLRKNTLNLFVLGGGSNVLVSDHGFDGLVLKIATKGIEILEEDEKFITLKVAAGECWDDFVAQAISKGWWGIENLSYIPGSVGAVAIQNVGAYGQEASEVIDAVEVCDILTAEVHVIPNEQCRFAYRRSVFNSDMKGKYIILHTVFRCKKHGKPNIQYHDLKAFFKNSTPATLQQIREAVIGIRQRKLPDPKELGNAGSFFKNLLLTPDAFGRLKARIKSSLGDEAIFKLEALRHKLSSPEEIKLPTAFLLDLCGLKGTKVGGAALYEKHPLIIVNVTGRASAHDVMTLMKTLRQKVFRSTGIEIMPEPHLIGFSREELRGYFLLQ